MKKGGTHNQITKNKMSQSRIGNKNAFGKRWKLSEETRKKQSLAQTGNKKGLGTKMSETHKNKMRLLMSGENNPMFGKRGIRSPFFGKPRKDMIGINNHNWKGGITPINKAIRESIEYKLWRTAVFERDNYTCVWCGVMGVYLHADHIKPFAYFPELRFAIDNGRTLCVPCHRTTDTWGKKIKN